MKRAELAGRLHLSTIGSDSRQMAMQYGLGLEIADFCTAVNLDQNVAAHRMAVRKEMEGSGASGSTRPLRSCRLPPLIRRCAG